VLVDADAGGREDLCALDEGSGVFRDGEVRRD